jgi:predicted lipoprotein with Yx(FWY)xxD motif/predicted outer membrane protein
VTTTGKPGKSGKPVLSTTKSGSFGVVVIDAKGHTLYRFDKDSAAPSRSNCVGTCVRKWPPVLAGDQLSTKGLDQGLVGRVKRRDGRWQLTLAGWPLYRYAGDRSLGDVKGQNDDGVWFAIGPDGKKAEPGNVSTARTNGNTTGNGTTTKWGPLTAADRDLLVNVQQEWLWEMPAADQARRQAKSAELKQAAEQLFAPRDDLKEEIRSLAAGLHVTVPTQPGADQRKWMGELSASAGNDYDKRFVNLLRASQGRLLIAAAQVRASTRNSLVRDFAQRTVGTVMIRMKTLETTDLVGS